MVLEERAVFKFTLKEDGSERYAIQTIWGDSSAYKNVVNIGYIPGTSDLERFQKENENLFTREEMEKFIEDKIKNINKINEGSIVQGRYTSDRLDECLNAYKDVKAKL